MFKTVEIYSAVFDFHAFFAQPRDFFRRAGGIPAHGTVASHHAVAGSDPRPASGTGGVKILTERVPHRARRARDPERPGDTGVRSHHASRNAAREGVHFFVDTRAKLCF